MSFSLWLQDSMAPSGQNFHLVQPRFIRMVAGMGNLTKLGLTYLQDRQERGEMIESYKILTRKVDVNPDIWFTSIGSREGAANTRATHGHLNLARREAASETRKNQFSARVVPSWNA